MYFDDLGCRWYFPLASNVVTVGWISPLVRMRRGPVPPTFTYVLARHLETRQFRPWMFRGKHMCEFCERVSDTGELFIPTPTRLYLAPVMIGHYVADHDYCPPAEFIEAVLTCPAQASPEFFELVQRFEPICDGFRVRLPQK